MIRSEQEIESIVSQVSGTWIKRRNARNKLISESNSEVNKKISECKGKVRDLRAMGVKEEALRHWYAEVTKYELMLLEV